ncbi:heavy metal translocating P-type ATPase [Paenibacillus sp. 1001270B_150601_E10]|uniref:heavy metal translocating P-type ATPase n=1 Tax=Paenibacillus sp. 1001270B_150601_E10 TaxID=2787079 RepID=UPI001E28E645|nr:heavy metal translocating P-type ATPase [Paenibacillus sp. 1001270B_150601_E10]
MKTTNTNMAAARTAPAPTAKSPQQKPEKNDRLKEMLHKYRELLPPIGAGLFTLIAWITSHGSDSIATALYIAAFIIGGFQQAKEGLETLVKERDLDVNLLMILAAIGAGSIGYWAEGAILIFIFSLSGALEEMTMERSSKDISALMDLKPETAIRMENGMEIQVNATELQLGDVIVVRNGERIPADGEVIEGRSSVDQASITGESIPVDKAVGDEVFAGTLNGEGALYIKVTAASESSLFAKIITLVQEAQSEMPKSQRFMESFERIYARAVLGVTILLILLPPLLLSWTWGEASYKAMVFLVVASPCALVASIMPAMLSAISNSARRGVLFKGGAHLENLANVKVIAFDKTGTLTKGRPEVTDIKVYHDMSEDQLLSRAASVESLTKHPLARAIVSLAETRQLLIERPTDFQAITGWGVQANLEGDAWSIGKPGWFMQHGLEGAIQHDLHRLEQEGKTVIVISKNKSVVGIIALQDQIRSETKAVMARLHALGIQTAMLTGDQERTAIAIAEQAGIDLVYAELLPEEKLDIVKQLQSEYGSIAMVGDGVNDAPALAAANVGIAMGAAGSDVALETADLVLMNDDLNKIEGAITLGKRMKRVIKQNMLFASIVIISLILSNFISGIPLPLGVVGHEGSTILVILNGLRLLRNG